MIYLTLFLEFFKIGLFSFGGAFGMIPLIKETVLSHLWLAESEFYDLIGVCESTPGPIAVNMATYIGSIQAGLLGSTVATLGVVLPSFIIILIVASVLRNLTQNGFFKAAIGGIAPVIVGLILSTGVLLARKSLISSPFDPVPLVILTLLVSIWAVSKFVFKRPLKTIPIILISVVLGIGVSILFEVL